MNDFTLVRKNLFRNGLRSALLIVSILIAFLLFGALVGYSVSTSAGVTAGGAKDRLVITNKLGFVSPLPYAYLGRVLQMEGVKDATTFNWFGGYYQEPQNFLLMGAVDPVSYLRIYKDRYQLPEEQKKAFIETRTGLLVGKAIADQYGFKVGDTIPIQSNIYSQRDGRKSWDFIVSGIYTTDLPGTAANEVMMHYEYFNETVSFGNNFLGTITVAPKDPAAMDALIKRIDASFANSAYESKTQTEDVFNQAFANQFGDVQFIITLVVAAGFAAILMIVGNTMVMAVRERTKEIGVMKTLGFSSGRILRMVLAESVLLAVIGAALGLTLASGLLYMFSQAPQAKLFLPPLFLPTSVGLVGFAIALALGLATGALPADSAFRLKIIEALSRR